MKKSFWRSLGNFLAEGVGQKPLRACDVYVLDYVDQTYALRTEVDDEVELLV